MQKTALLLVVAVVVISVSATGKPKQKEATGSTLKEMAQAGLKASGKTAGSLKPMTLGKATKEKLARAVKSAPRAGGRPKKMHEANGKKKCPPKLTRASMIQRSIKARALAAAALPDPECKTGILSLAGSGPETQVCCPAYCGECSDYPTCSSVKGQASENACCASQVFSLSCEHSDTGADKCLKGCTEKTPPCIMAEGETFEMPEMTSAAEDCNNAVLEYMTGAKDAIVGVEGGEEQWKYQNTYKLK